MPPGKSSAGIDHVPSSPTVAVATATGGSLSSNSVIVSSAVPVPLRPYSFAASTPGASGAVPSIAETSVGSLVLPAASVAVTEPAKPSVVPSGKSSAEIDQLPSPSTVAVAITFAGSASSNSVTVLFGSAVPLRPSALALITSGANGAVSSTAGCDVLFA